MKSLQESLFDADLVSKDVIIYHPKTKHELIDCVEEQLDIQGPDANLNIIDVSNITNMQSVFRGLNLGNIDISEWDVSKVENMINMFRDCEKFNADLSKWNVKNVEYMRSMFCGCKNFDSDLSKWDVRNVEYMRSIFDGCKSLKKIPSWYHL